MTSQEDPARAGRNMHTVMIMVSSSAMAMAPTLCTPEMTLMAALALNLMTVWQGGLKLQLKHAGFTGEEAGKFLGAGGTHGCVFLAIALH